ncbi:MAG TPA: hypothetical protein VFL60_04595 [Gaiellaceae bacterium]|nr:hypothetical protein [Gaiellaceae bacterium]
MAAPLVPRWRAVEHGPVEAGAAHAMTVEVENAGSAPWRTRGPEEGLFLSYHWLDERGNPIVWDGERTPLERVVGPGETLRQELRVRGPIPPGRYRFAVDLVEEHRFWVAELGNAAHEEDVDVRPRSGSPRVYGAAPDEAWRAHAAELHREGYAAVGGAVDGLRDYPAGGGRSPRFPHPLVCPSLLPPLEPNCEVDGLPAWSAEDDEPFMYDGRLVLRLR